MNKVAIPMRRVGHKLEITSEVWVDMLEEYPEGVDLNVKITRARSVKQNGYYWVGLGIAQHNLSDAETLKWPTPRKIHKSLLVDLGYVETVWSFSGVPSIQADSTAFKNMKTEEFNTYFERARVMLTDHLGYDPWQEMKYERAS